MAAMPEGRRDRLAAAVGRAEGPARWLARVSTGASVAAVPPALLVWWRTAGPGLGDGTQATVGSIVILVAVLAPAGWLLNVRFALLALVALPATLDEVARRRGGQLRGWASSPAVPSRPAGGVLGATRAVRGVVRDYGDVAGSWGVVAQLVAPTFWLLTVVAFLAVPVLWLAALVAVVVG